MASTSLPNDSATELAVLCSCLSSVDVLNGAVQFLDAEDFFCGNNGLIFRGMKDFYEENIPLRPAPLITKLSKQLTDQEKKTLLNHFELNLYERARESIHLIKDLSKKRRLIMQAHELLKRVGDNDSDSEKLFDQHVKNLHDSFSKASTEVETFSDVMANFKDGKTYKQYIKEKYDLVQNGGSPYQGVTSGYHKLDYAIGSFQNGSLTYIGGLTSTGKTAFMLNLMYNMVHQGTKVGFISLEMHKSIVMQNILAMKLCIPVQRIQRSTLTKEECLRIMEVNDREPIFTNVIIDGGETDINVICSRIRRMVRNHGVKIIFIDYLTCMTVSGRYNTNSERVNVISKSLQALGKELNIPIICLAQFNREADKATEAPKLSHFKESGSIEQDADVCIILHRPQRVNKASCDRTLHVKIEKNRLMGELSTIHYLWDDTRWGFYQELDDPTIYMQQVTYQSTQREKSYDIY